MCGTTPAVYSLSILSTSLGQSYPTFCSQSSDKVSPTTGYTRKISPSILIITPSHESMTIHTRSKTILTKRPSRPSWVPSFKRNTSTYQTPALVPFLSTPYDARVSPYILILVTRSDESTRTLCATSLKPPVTHVRHSNAHDFQTSGLYAAI